MSVKTLVRIPPCLTIYSLKKLKCGIVQIYTRCSQHQCMMHFDSCDMADVVSQHGALQIFLSLQGGGYYEDQTNGRADY